MQRYKKFSKFSVFIRFTLVFQPAVLICFYHKLRNCCIRCRSFDCHRCCNVHERRVQAWIDEIKSQKRVHYKWTLNTPVLRRLSNLFTIEISTVHVLNIYFYTVLVQKQLCQHWSFSWNPNGRYRRNRTCLDEHTFFKSLSFVFTSSVAAVFDYNSPKCHNNWFRWLFMIRFLIWAA